jgi:hypothetical protein
MTSKETDDLNLLFTWRKTLLVSTLYIVGGIFRIKGLINGSEFVDLIKNVTVAFLASNGFEYAASTARTYFNSQGPGPTTVDVQASTQSK